MKKEKRYRISLVILTVVLILSALAAESLYFSHFEYHIMTRRFNRKLGEKEKLMDAYLNRLKPLLARDEFHDSQIERNILTAATRNEITILYYLDNKLIHWSENDFDVPATLDDSIFLKPLIFMQNGWFLPQKVQVGNETIVGLLRVRTDYTFENDIVKSGFVEDFRMPDKAGLSSLKNPADYNIFNSKGTFLFSLTFPVDKSNTLLIILPVVLWTAVLILIILLLFELVKMLVKEGKNYTGLLICFFFSATLYTTLLVSKGPEVFSRIGLFSPYIFSLNTFIPSLGHLLLLSILVAVISYGFYKYFPGFGIRKEKSKQELPGTILLLMTSALLVCLSHNLFTHLITDSNISFETYKVLKLSLFSVAGLVSVIFLLMAPLFILLKILRDSKEVNLKTGILLVLPSLVLIIIFFYDDILSLLTVLIFYVCLLFVAWLTEKRKTVIFSISVIFSLLIGLYSLLIITVFSEKKTNENIKVQATLFID